MSRWHERETNGAAGAPEKFSDRPTLQKQFLMKKLGKAIEEVLRESAKRG
jgi:hypothetical protein